MVDTLSLSEAIYIVDKNITIRAASQLSGETRNFSPHLTSPVRGEEIERK